MAGRVTSPEFVGRTEQLATLDAALRRAERGEAAAAFVAGDSGVGKTRLLRELERRATARGVAVLRGDCVAFGAGELPYAPIDDALFMAEKTASVHVSRILAKLGVRSRVEAATAAHRLGLTMPSDD